MLATVFQYLLGSLEGHVWLVAGHMIPSQLLLALTQDITLAALRIFIEDLAHVTDLHEYIQQKPKLESTGPYSLLTTNVIMPSERVALCRLKCTLLVRIFDFLQVMISDSKLTVEILKKSSVLGSKTYNLLITSVLSPSSLGFDLRDTDVLNNLLPRLGAVLTSLLKTLPTVEKVDLMRVLERQLMTQQRPLLELIADGTQSVVPAGAEHLLRGIAVLHSTEWMQQCSPAVVAGHTSLPRMLLRWAANLLLGKTETSSVILQEFAQKALQIAVQMDQEVRVKQPLY